MTQNLTNESRMKFKVNRRHDELLGAPPEHILREIAFVLRMTERVREEIEVEQEEDVLVEA